MKKIIAIVLCMCAFLSVCVGFFSDKQETAVDDTVTALASKNQPNPEVRDGAPGEGIYLL